MELARAWMGDAGDQWVAEVANEKGFGLRLLENEAKTWMKRISVGESKFNGERKKDDQRTEHRRKGRWLPFTNQSSFAIAFLIENYLYSTDDMILCYPTYRSFLHRKSRWLPRFR